MSLLSDPQLPEGWPCYRLLCLDGSYNCGLKSKGLQIGRASNLI